MISAHKFTANLRSFATLDNTARTLFAETCAYVLWQYHAHGNKDPYLKLKDAPLPGWIRDAFGKLHLGKRDRAIDDRTADMRGDAYAATVFSSRQEKKDAAKLKREAKAATPKPEVIEGELREIMHGLIYAGELLELSEAEAEALVAALTKMRQPVLRVA